MARTGRGSLVGRMAPSRNGRRRQTYRGGTPRGGPAAHPGRARAGGDRAAPARGPRRRRRRLLPASRASRSRRVRPASAGRSTWPSRRRRDATTTRPRRSCRRRRRSSSEQATPVRRTPLGLLARRAPFAEPSPRPRTTLPATESTRRGRAARRGAPPGTPFVPARSPFAEPRRPAPTPGGARAAPPHLEPRRSLRRRSPRPRRTSRSRRLEVEPEPRTPAPSMAACRAPCPAVSGRGPQPLDDGPAAPGAGRPPPARGARASSSSPSAKRRRVGPPSSVGPEAVAHDFARSTRQSRRRARPRGARPPDHGAGSGWTHAAAHDRPRRLRGSGKTTDHRQALPRVSRAARAVGGGAGLASPRTAACGRLRLGVGVLSADESPARPRRRRSVRPAAGERWPNDAHRRDPGRHAAPVTGRGSPSSWAARAVGGHVRAAGDAQLRRAAEARSRCAAMGPDASRAHARRRDRVARSAPR